MDPEHPSTPRPDEASPDLSILAKIEGELADVDQALSRLDEGAYGVCQACGEPIDDERLGAEPATPFCREHAAS